MREYHEFPKYKFADGEEPTVVHSAEEEAQLGDGWFDRPDLTNNPANVADAVTTALPPAYVAVAYPRMLFKPDVEPRIVDDAEGEAAALEEGYFHKPDFTNVEPVEDEADEEDDTSSTTTTTTTTTTAPVKAPAKATDAEDLL